MSLWVALDVVPGNTAVRYAAGSHKWHLKHRIKSFSGDSGRYAGSEALPVIPDIDELERKGEVRFDRIRRIPGRVSEIQKDILNIARERGRRKFA